MTDRVAARRFFKEALDHLQASRYSQALAKFSAATDIEPTMADAWLGRVMACDESLDTLRAVYRNGERLGRESKLNVVSMKAQLQVGPYLVIEATNRAHVGIGLAAALIAEGHYGEASALLEDPALVSDPTGWQWRQYVRTYLMYETQRWPDVIAEAAAELPGHAMVLHDVTAAIAVQAASAAAGLGQSQVALEWADKAHTENPGVLADLAYTRGMVHRQLGDNAAAASWLGRASINGQLIEAAKEALKNTDLRLVVVDENEIATRTDRWDATTQKSASEQHDEQNAELRAKLLEEGKRELANQIGLQEVKDTVRRLEEQIPVRALRLKRGLQVPNQTNHILLVGPPGTGKTTTAEALAKIYCGLGVVKYPEIREVRRSDFCAEHIGASGPKTRALIQESLGRILFMDEIYTLVEKHDSGKPDMIGMEAVNQLLIDLEKHRFDFCFMGAGYENKVDDFLEVNPGLASRFNGRLRFVSYTPTELIDIAGVYGAPRDTVLGDDARAMFLQACQRLEQYRGPDDDGVIRSGIDLLGNGRFARKVVEKAEGFRDSRLSEQAVIDPDSVTDDVLETVTAADVIPAIREVCAKIPADLI